jgi:RNA polymerase sigma factor (TIGR02999 family)
MEPGAVHDVTQLLVRWRSGDDRAREQLIPVVYDELRRMARRYLANERPGHTLQSTALVHEAYVRLVASQTPDWNDRAHFFGIAAQVMRQILVDHARKRHAARRGADAQRVTLDAAVALPERKGVDVLALDDALQTLAKLDSQQSRVVELRFFGGLTLEESAEVLGVSVSTVQRDWQTAKVWLRRELDRTTPA